MGVRKKTERCLILLFGLFLNACANYHTPAPVLTLDTSTPAQKASFEISSDTYQVEIGDTLFSIAFYSGNDYRELARINQINAPYSIFPGQMLRLSENSSNNKQIENKVLSQKSSTTTKVAVDPDNAQAYGEGEEKIHRKKSIKKADSSKITDYTYSWIWPASGKVTTTVVGSDGTIRGIDIKGEANSPIIAATDGKVVYAGNALKGYGNLVIIKHEDDYLSAYAHNEKILVDEQTYVKQGQKIATMGRSGTNETRLHFEIRKKGKSLDPTQFLPKQR
ncbi:peptidoglycan DD-metalloendopeptidase family protein [Glaciecola sp. KUL10]|uniref:peptidoglycan DD-metalloendopeptidase family protein n=1 Tax=Glaciecola sp. (strain KUL10) TaxID=2161813 RepID=UPI000D78540A|nr:peptidoglycan DD-metalloendopeptidase family protein [Glaciecola sp. KUL10]GBL05116.1 lipoprotein NlpD [Glaciecola sp. KUL10]